MSSPLDGNGVDPSFPAALSDSEVRIWINACNHEPAREALRQLLAYRRVSAPLASSHTAVEPVGELVERLRAGEAETRGYEVVWVQNLRAFIDTDMFRSFPEWRQIFRREVDALLLAASEAASTLTAQAAALVAAKKTIHDAECALYGRHERGFAMKPLINPSTLAEEIATLKGRVAELEAGLEPFAKHLDEMKFDRDNNGNELPDDQSVGWVYVTNGDFRLARRLTHQEKNNG